MNGLAIIKNFGRKVSDKLSYIKNIAYLGLTGALTTTVNPAIVNAKTANARNMFTNSKQDADATNLVLTIVNTVVGLFPLIGVFFVVSGVFKLILAYRSDNPEGQTAAAKDIVIGAVFIVFTIVWNPISNAIFGGE